MVKIVVVRVNLVYLFYRSVSIDWSKVEGRRSKVEGRRSKAKVEGLFCFFVGEAGVYVARVVDRKVSRGQVYLLADVDPEVVTERQREGT